MKLGLFLMPLHRPDRPHADTYREDLELVEYADRLGFAETWVGEHFNLPWENMPSPELFIAQALEVAPRMKFGTGVSLLGFHHPAHVALRIAQLDHMSRGRVYLGIGAGGGGADAEMFGVNMDAGGARERMAESIEVILKIWKGEPFEHVGRFYKSAIAEPRPEYRIGFHMKPYQDPHPPIAVAGSSPHSGTLEMVGEKGWIPMSSAFLHESFLPSHREVFERGARRGGMPVPANKWRIAREAFVADDGAKARRDALNGPLGSFFTDYWIPLFGYGDRGLSALKTDPDTPDAEVTPEYMLENLWIVGDPDECARRIRRMRDAVGGFGTLLLMCHDWANDRPKWFRSLELMAKEVMPLVNGS